MNRLTGLVAAAGCLAAACTTTEPPAQGPVPVPRPPTVAYLGTPSHPGVVLSGDSFRVRGVRVDGTAARTLAEVPWAYGGPGRQERPVFSPDGSLVSYLDRRPPWLDVVADDRVVMRLRTNTVQAGAVDAAWSPDSRRVAVPYQTGAGWYGHVKAVLAIVRVSTGRVLQRFSWGDTSIQSVSWSHDGRRLAVVGAAIVPTPAWYPGPASDRPPVGRLEILRADGTGRRTLRQPVYRNVAYAAWAPDGSTLAVASHWPRLHRWTGTRLFVARADGSSPRPLPLSAASEVRWVAWSPDSSRLLVNRWGPHSSSELWALDADGTGERKLGASGDLPSADWCG